MMDHKYELKIEELDTSNLWQMNLLSAFCKECAELGIYNNSSIHSLKIELFKSLKLKYWIVIDLKLNKICGIAGAHQVPEISSGCYRLLFRGCMLPEYRGIGNGGLSKNHLNSYLFKNLGPIQLKYARENGAHLTIVSTNVEQNGGLSKTDRIFKLLYKNNRVRLVYENYKLYNTYQNIWEVSEKTFSL